MSRSPFGGRSRARLLARGGTALAASVAALTGLAPGLASAAVPPRAFELVSPVDTGDQAAVPGGVGFTPALRVLGDGRFAMSQAFVSQFAEAGNGYGAVYASERTPSGWRQTPLDPPASEQRGLEGYVLLEALPDLSRTLLFGAYSQSIFIGGVADRFAGASSLLLRDRDGSMTTVVSSPAGAPYVGFVSASRRLDAVAFETWAQLAGDTHATGSQVYLWRDGRTMPAGVDANGVSFPCGAMRPSAYVDPKPVSGDGSTVYFMSVGTGADCFAIPDLYAFRDGRSWQISKPDAGVVDPDGEREAGLVATSHDGRVAYFATQQRLTAEDLNGGTGPNDGRDLYRSVLPADGGERVLTCISCGEGPGNDAMMVGGLGNFGLMSADRSHLFFATGQPIDGRGAADNFAEGNLWVLADGELRLVSERIGVGGFGPDRLHVTPDGRHLLVRSPVNLTAFDARGTDQAYLFSEREDGGYAVQCVSCAPQAADPAAGVVLTSAFNQVLSDDARTVAFTSRDALTPSAVAGVMNLYEWHEGELALVHTGQGPIDPQLIGLSGDGTDLYFDAFGRLAPEARQAVDGIYDARRGGGFPAAPEPPGQCSGSGCRPVTPPPPLPVAGTVTFAGAETRDEPRPAASRMRVVRTSSRAGTVRVDVKVGARGRISVSGARVRRIARTVRRGGTYRLAVTLTPRARRLLRRHGRAKVRLRIDYRPASGATRSTALTLTVKGER